MNWRDEFHASERFSLLVIAVPFFVLLSIALFQPYFEARQYEAMTGKAATYWDAFWLDLRVVSEAKEQR